MKQRTGWAFSKRFSPWDQPSNTKIEYKCVGTGIGKLPSDKDELLARSAPAPYASCLCLVNSMQAPDSQMAGQRADHRLLV